MTPVAMIFHGEIDSGKRRLLLQQQPPQDEYNDSQLNETALRSRNSDLTFVKRLRNFKAESGFGSIATSR